MWLSPENLKVVKKKTEAYKRYLDTREGEDFVQYARIRNQIRWECRKEKRKFEKELAKEIKQNPKAFYSYANTKLKTKSGIENLKTLNGKANIVKEKAEALNDFFANLFTHEDTAEVPKLSV